MTCDSALKVFGVHSINQVSDQPRGNRKGIRGTSRR